MSALYDYMEPFSAECRAFGRLQESGHEELAVLCFGYVLLDEEHERAMMTRFDFNKWSFNGNYDTAGTPPPGEEDEDSENRLRFLGKNGRPPPLRCIVKAFGQGIGEFEEDSFRQGMARRVLRDIIKLQKLGIMQIDVGIRQMIDGKIGDFSTAITMPHFITSPELNPNLTPGMIDAMGKATFEHCMNDYLDFDSMIHEWNWEFGEEKGHMSIEAYPGGRGCPYNVRYNLRSNTARKSLYTFVDPRKYGWTASPSSGGTSRAVTSKKRQSGWISKNVKRQASLGRDSKPRPQQLTARPDMWYYEYEDKDKSWARGSVITIPHSITWTYKNGCLFPVRSAGNDIK